MEAELISTKKNTGQHLRPHWWEPGKSGNPKGRPVGRHTLECEMFDLISRTAKVTDPDGNTRRVRRVTQLAQALLYWALAPDTSDRLRNTVLNLLIPRLWPVEKSEIKMVQANIVQLAHGNPLVKRVRAMSNGNKVQPEHVLEALKELNGNGRAEACETQASSSPS